MLVAVSAALLLCGCSRRAPLTPQLQQVAADLRRVDVVEIIAHRLLPGGSLLAPDANTEGAVIAVIDSKTKPAIVKQLMDDLTNVLRPGEPALALIVPIWLRFRSQKDSWAYFCRYDPKHDYLEIYLKTNWPPASSEWPPKGARMVTIPCRTSPRFRDTILDTLPDSTRSKFD